MPYYPMTSTMRAIWEDWAATVPKRHQHRGVAFYDRERQRKPLGPAGVTDPHTQEFRPFTYKGESPWAEWEAAYKPSPPAEITYLAGDDWQLERVEGSSEGFVWLLTFPDAEFRFASFELADAARAELIKIRKARHPRPKAQLVPHWSRRRPMFDLPRLAKKRAA